MFSKFLTILTVPPFPDSLLKDSPNILLRVSNPFSLAFLASSLVGRSALGPIFVLRLGSAKKSTSKSSKSSVSISSPVSSLLSTRFCSLALSFSKACNVLFIPSSTISAPLLASSTSCSLATAIAFSISSKEPSLNISSVLSSVVSSAVFSVLVPFFSSA